MERIDELAMIVFKDTMLQMNLCDKLDNEAEYDKAISKVVRYFYKNQSEYDVNKGLLLSGKVGQGKTMVFQVVKRMMQRALGNSFVFVTHAEILNKFKRGGEESLKMYENCVHLVIDDILDESKVKSFGNDYSIDELLRVRYAKWQEFGYLTSITTNMGSEKLRDVLDERVFDRLLQMCNLVKWQFSNESHRGKTFNEEEVKEFKERVMAGRKALKGDLYTQAEHLENVCKPAYLANPNIEPIPNAKIYESISRVYRAKVDFTGVDKMALIAYEREITPKHFRSSQNYLDANLNELRVSNRAYGRYIFQWMCNNNQSFIPNNKELF